MSYRFFCWYYWWPYCQGKLSDTRWSLHPVSMSLVKELVKNPDSGKMTTLSPSNQPSVKNGGFPQT